MFIGYMHINSIYSGTALLRDHDYLKLQFLGAKNAWLGCHDHGPSTLCILATCPSISHNYRNFEYCWGENFQIIGEGAIHNSIKSGQRIRLRYLNEQNTWMGCSLNNRCDKRTCSGTTSQGSNFNDGCWGNIFRIYARGRKNGQTIYNGDVIVLYYVHGGRYVSIQGQYNQDRTSLDFCPGVAPPAYLSYGICSKNVFRIYRKP